MSFQQRTLLHQLGYHSQNTRAMRQNIFACESMMLQCSLERNFTSLASLGAAKTRVSLSLRMDDCKGGLVPIPRRCTGFVPADRPQVLAMIALVLAWFVHVQWPPPPITVMNGHASLCGAHGREASRSPNRFTPVCYAMVASGESTRYIGRPCLHETAVKMHDGLESIRILLSMETGWMVTAGVITRTFRFRLELC